LLRWIWCFNPGLLYLILLLQAVFTVESHSIYYNAERWSKWEIILPRSSCSSRNRWLVHSVPTAAMTLTYMTSSFLSFHHVNVNIYKQQYIVETRVASHESRLDVSEIRYDTIAEFNVDSKAEYSALSSTRRKKKKLKQTTPVPL